MTKKINEGEENTHCNGLFIHAIDQNYEDDIKEVIKEDVRDNFKNSNTNREQIDLMKFYDDLIDDKDGIELIDHIEHIEEHIELKSCCTKNIPRKKNRFKKLLKPKWEEKISLMKTNYFLIVKNTTIRNMECFKKLYLGDICEVLKFVIKYLGMKNINRGENCKDME